MPVKNQDGHWLDAKGRPNPPHLIPALKKKQDSITEQIIKRTIVMNKRLIEHKKYVLKKVQEMNEFAMKKKGVKAITENGYCTLTNFNQTMKVEITSNDIISFDQVNLNAAQTKFNECIRKWSLGTRDELIFLVNKAFELDKRGQVNKNKLLSLLSIEIEDPDWIAAQNFLMSAIQIDVTKQYENFWTREPGGQWQPIILYYQRLNVKDIA